MHRAVTTGKKTLLNAADGHWDWACCSRVSPVCYWWRHAGRVDRVRPADEGTFPAISKSPQQSWPRTESCFRRRFVTALSCFQPRRSATTWRADLRRAVYLEQLAERLWMSALLFNLFCFQSEREVSVLWELVIDVAIVSPAPAETTRRRRSVLGRHSLHPGPSTQLLLSLWPGCTWSRTKPIIVKYSMSCTSGVGQKSSNLFIGTVETGAAGTRDWFTGHWWPQCSSQQALSPG